MRRIQFIEISDQPWCPAVIRDGVTAYLAFVIGLFRPYAAAVPMLVEVLERTGQRHVIDLCAGGGGPWSWLLPLLRRDLDKDGQAPVTVELTDKFPNEKAPEALPNGVTYNSTPVDATALQSSAPGFRTAFTALHHFPPEVVEKILADAVAKQEGIAVFECTRRHPLAALFFVPMPLFVWLTLPFMRPLRWQYLVFTYLIPAIPFILAFDGVVSCLRTYTPQETLAMAKRADRQQRFQWRAGSVKAVPVGMLYLIGSPLTPPQAPEATAAPRPR